MWGPVGAAPGDRSQGGWHRRDVESTCPLLLGPRPVTGWPPLPCEARRGLILGFDLRHFGLLILSLCLPPSSRLLRPRSQFSSCWWLPWSRGKPPTSCGPDPSWFLGGRGTLHLGHPLSGQPQGTGC